MLVEVFRSSRKKETYLYLPRGANFDELPEVLRQTFGSPELALSLNLTSERQLARYDAEEVLSAIAAQGFFLQLPPGCPAEASGDADAD
ncbi:MAG: YcgL domain-containing protein [Luminiphilus sp.]|nr:YcgL domain-containing protein [Luminiphilus sp.]